MTAAVWEAVFTAGLIPVVVTPTKFYGVFADPERLLAAAERVVAGSDDFWAERQEIAGHGVLRMRLQQPPKPAPPLPVDYDRVESVVTATLDRRLGRLEGTLSASLDPRLRRAALDASTITRTRRWLRGLARPSRA